MKQMSQIKGFGRQEIAHLAPVNSIKELEEKQPKHQSLIQKCLKSLVKQKLTGCLINMSRKKRQSEERSSSNKKIHDKSYQDLYGFLNSSIKKRRYVNPELKPFFPDQNSSKETRNPSTMMSINERISKMSIKNKDRYRLINETQPLLEKIKQDLNIHRISQIKKRNQPSFISSIQLNDEQKQGKKSLHTSPEDRPEFNSLIKLPKLDNRSSSIIIKNVIRKNSNYNINHQFWKYLTNQNDTSIRKRKTSTTSDINLLISINQAAKEVKSSLFKPTIPSSSRENFQSYLNNLPRPFKRLIEFVISFFNIKIPNQLSALFYSKMLDELNAVNKRAWSVVGFVFWDFNRDGVINSKDLFDIFRLYNQFDQNQISKEKKSQSDQKYISQKSLENKKQGSSQKERSAKKQNEIHTQILSNIKSMQRALKKFKPEFQKQKEKEKTEGSNQFQELKNFQNAKFINDEMSKRPCLQLQNVQKAIEIFKSQILKLNSRLSSGSYSNIDYQQLKEPEEKLISFLQEIVLTQSNLKYEDIQPLFSAGANSKDDHEHKLQLFPKDLNVKCSSSYKQCFVSTEHNEETRLLREKIQHYKLKLKEKRSNKNKILQQKIQRNLKLQKELNYVKAAQSTMGQIVKDILFNLLGYEE